MNFDQRFLQKCIENYSNGLVNSNGISRATVFEVRMREMDLFVGRIMAIVFCAPKHKCIYPPRLSMKWVFGVGPWPACRTYAGSWTMLGWSWW